MFQIDNATAQSNAAHDAVNVSGLSAIRDSFAPKSKRISDAFAEAFRAKAAFEAVPTAGSFASFDYAVGEVKVTLHLTPNNPFYEAHMDRHQTLVAQRRALNAKYEPRGTGR